MARYLVFLFLRETGRFCGKRVVPSARSHPRTRAHAHRANTRQHSHSGAACSAGTAAGGGRYACTRAAPAPTFAPHTCHVCTAGMCVQWTRVPARFWRECRPPVSQHIRICIRMYTCIYKHMHVCTYSRQWSHASQDSRQTRATRVPRRGLPWRTRGQSACPSAACVRLESPQTALRSRTSARQSCPRCVLHIHGSMNK